MNIYDFDGTIYNGDSTIDFYIWCLYKHPKLLCSIPCIIYYFFKYMFGILSREDFKKKYFHFLVHLNNPQIDIKTFTIAYKHKVAGWYIQQAKTDDVIVSASPEFIVSSICNCFGIHHVIATKINPVNGHFLSSNCRGEEKVLRFRKLYPNDNINCFFSDTLSDTPLAVLAEQAFLVKKGKRSPWPSAIKH